MCPINGAFTTGKCHSRFENRLFQALNVKMCTDTWGVDFNYFLLKFRASGAPPLKAITCIVASNKQDGLKQAESLC
jgi:hypothetical protein